MSKKSAFPGNKPAARVHDGLRCPKCEAAPTPYGMERLGTQMISEILRVYQEDGPNVDIGRVIRCGNPACDAPPVVKLWKAGVDMGINPADAYRLVKSCRGTLTFKLHELFSGQLDAVEVPEWMKVRPIFGQPVPEAPRDPGLFAEEVPPL
jgi:hypothetical protein